MAKLTYFNTPGRSIGIRIALTIAGVSFENETLSWADYQERKGKGEFTTGVPLFTTAKGKTVSQSGAILRYACKKANLYSDDADTALVIDEITDISYDILNNCPHDSDADVKKKKREEYAAGKMKNLCDLLSSKLSENGGPFLAGESLSMADLAFLMISNMVIKGDFDYVPKDYFNGFEGLSELHERIMNHEGVKKWTCRDM